MALFVSCAGARSSGRAGSEGSDPTLGLSLVHTLRGTGSPAGSAGPGSYRWAWGSGSAQPNTQTEAGRRILKRRQVLLIQENAPRLPSSRGNAVVGAEEVLPFGNLFLDVHSYPRRWSRGGGWQPHSVYTLEHVTWRLWFTGEWTSGLRLSGASVDTFPARTALGSSPRKRVPGA